MRVIFLFLIPIFIYADSLEALLRFAHSNNELLESKNLLKHSKESSLKSIKNSYYPKINMGGFYNRSDEASPFLPGTTYSAYAKVSLDVYSGGERYYTKKQKSDELLSSKYDYEAAKKDISLAITQDFYNIKNMDAKIEALADSLLAVKAQLQKTEQYFNAKLATSDDVDRLQAAYDKNAYFLESAKFELLSLRKKLEVKVGKTIKSFEDSSFVKKENDIVETSDTIKVLQYKKSSLYSAAEIVSSYYYPHIKLEDTYSFYGYQDEPSFGGLPIPLLEKQNVLMATFNINIFDFSAVSERRQAIRLNADAIAKQIAYKTKEQKMQIELAKSRIKMARLNIKSARSALRASKSALNTITQKYNNAIVDNIVYLDALSLQTETKATYETSLNNLEIAYALYYYYNGKKLEEFLNE